MHYPAKNPKKFKYLMSLLGLLTIVSMLLAPAVQGQSLSTQGITETVTLASPVSEQTATEELPQSGPSDPTPVEDGSGPEEGLTPSATQETSEASDDEETPTPEDEIQSTESATPAPQDEEPTEELTETETEIPDSPSETPTPENSVTPEEEATEASTEEGTPEEPTETLAPTEVTRQSVETEEVDRQGSGAECEQDPYCYKIDPGTNSGSYTAPGPIVTFSVKAGSNLITYSPPGTSSHSRNYCWSVNITGSTVSWSRNYYSSKCQDPSHLEIKWENPPTPEPGPISASAECLTDGRHKVTVTSSSGQSVLVNWTSSTGEHGWSWVTSWQSYTFYTSSAGQTISFSYYYNWNEIKFSLNAEACATVSDLTLDYTCLTDAQHEWTVSNTNGFDINYTWTSTTGQSGQGTAPAGGSDTFQTNNDYQTVTVKYTFPDKDRCGEDRCGGSEEEIIRVTAEECKLTIEDLELSYECLDNGQHKWTVTNNNNYDISYYWGSDTDGQYGNGTAPANGTDIFYTNNKDQTVTISYNIPSPDRTFWFDRTLSVEAEICALPQKLTLAVECLPNGDHQWTVTNNNPSSITFDWASNNGIDSGTGLSVNGNGGTKTFVSNYQAQEVTLTYNFAGETGITVFKATEEVCVVPQKLELSVECLLNGDHQWTVTNNNPDAIIFDWESNNGSNNGSDSGTSLSVAGNGGTKTFTSNHEAQTVTLTYDYAGETGIEVSKVTEEVCALPQKLTISVVCLTNGDHQWTVTNNNPVSITFDWGSSNGVDSGSGLVVAGNGGTINFTSNIAAQTVTLTYDYAGQTGITVTSDEAYICNQPIDLVLEYECLDNGQHKWTVTNNNDFAIDYNWDSNVGSQSGSSAIAGGGTDIFYTNNAAQTVTLSYDFPATVRTVAFERSVSATAEVCALPQELTLSVECLPNGDHQWTVTNTNANAITFDWVSNNGIDSGTGLSVSGNGGTKTFVSNYQAQEVTLTYNFAGEIGITVFKATEEVCVVPQKLELSVECLLNGDHQWTVTNNNASAITFDWASNNGVDSGTGLTVNGGGTKTFTSNHEAQTVTLTYDYAGETGIEVSKVTEEVCALPQKLTISVVCLTNGDHQWTVTNNNPVSITFDWGSSNGVDSGSGLVVAGNGGTITFTSNIAAQTVTLTYDYAGETGITVTSSEANACDQPLDLVLEYVCLDDGQHKWTVTNNNDFTIDYNWDSNVGSQSGSDTIAAGGTDVFYTNNAAQTVTLYYNFPAIARVVAYERSVSATAEVCALPQKLTLEVECLLNGDHQWTVTNNNASAITFDWASNNGVDSGTGLTVNGGGTKTFTSNYEAQEVTLSYDFAGETGIEVSKVTEEVCVVPQELELSVECLPNGDHQWTVTNNNPDAITFDWESDNGSDSGSGLSVNGNGGTQTFTSNFEAQEVTLTYDYAGETGIQVSKAEEEACDAPELALTYMCGYPSDTQLLWRINNTNAFDVTFTWDVYGSSENGTGTVPANSYIYFNTTLGDKTVRVFVFGQLVNSKAGGSTCKVDLELDFECLVTGLHEWTVSNGNDFDQPFTWSSTSGDSGSGTAPAGGMATFTTGLETQTVTIEYQQSPHPAKEVEVLGEACKSPQLDLVFDCGYPTDTNLYWYVTNPNDVNIDFDWEAVGTTEKGTATAFANSNTYFTTSMDVESVQILVAGYEIDLEDSGESCLSPLSLSYECLDNGTQEWTVTNNNKDDQAFTWTSTNGENGSGVVKSGSVFTFTTSNTEHQVTLEYQHGAFPAQTTTAYGEACKITTETPPAVPTITVPVTDPEIAQCPQWIVFHTYRDDNLEVYRLDGVEGVGDYLLLNLTKGDSNDARPSRSFDNAWVAFQSDRDGNLEIYVTDSAGSQQIRLTDNKANDINAMFSPNNRDIAFQSDRNGNWDLFMIDRITGEEIQLTDNEADEIDPFFSMDQNWLTFESNRNGNWDIFLLNIATGEEFQVTDGEGDEIYPAWSPTGQQIAYLAETDGIWNLFVIDTNGENNIQITDGDGDTNYHAWSPDGTRLAYQSERDGNVDIYTYDLRDNTEYRVTDNEDRDIGPTWDCSGTNLSYTAESEDAAPDIYQVYWKGGESSFLTNHPAIDQWSEWSPAKETASREE